MDNILSLSTLTAEREEPINSVYVINSGVICPYITVNSTEFLSLGAGKLDVCVVPIVPASLSSCGERKKKGAVSLLKSHC